MVGYEEKRGFNPTIVAPTASTAIASPPTKRAFVLALAGWV